MTAVLHRCAALAAGLLIAFSAVPTTAAPDTPAASALPQGVTTVRSIEGVTEYHFANGLIVLLIPDDGAQKTLLNVVYKVGSRQESYGETGMAHLLEHMLFKDTPEHKNIPQELQKRGMVFNATTSFDRTNYFEQFNVGDENLGYALGLEADRMQHAPVTRKDLDSEMTVVRNEMENGENSPSGVLEKRLYSAAFGWHNYRNTTIGARSDVEHVPAERLQAFYHRYYRPDNAVLILAGRFNPAKALASIDATFGRIARPGTPVPELYTVEPAQDGEHNVMVRRVGDIQAIMVGYHIPAAGHPDAAALKVLAKILGDDPAGRLHKALVEKGLATSASATAELQIDPNLFVADAHLPKTGNAETAVKAMQQTIEGVANQAPTDEELQRAKSGLAKWYEMVTRDSVSVGNLLTEYVASGDWRLFFVRRDEIAAVTAADVQRVAAAYLQRSNRTTGVFAPLDKPERVDIPATPDLAARLKDYKGHEALAAGEALDPDPLKIEAKLQRFALNEGGKLVVLPKAARGHTVRVMMRLHFGDEASLTGKAQQAAYMAEMLKRGTSQHTRQQIADAMDRMKSVLQINGGGQTLTVSLTTDRANAAEAIALTGEVLRNPVFPANELEQVKAEDIAGIEAGKKNPASLARKMFSRAFDTHPAGHPDHVYTDAERVAQIKALSPATLKAFHDQFIGAQAMDVAVVGDIEVDTVRAEIEKAFKGFHASTAYVRMVEHPAKVAGLDEHVETPDKDGAFITGGQPLAMSVNDPQYPALVTATTILGGSTLHSRLGDRIRVKEGLSYGTQAGLDVDQVDASGALLVLASAAPQNIAAVKRGFVEEIARWRDQGVTAAELAEVQSEILNGLRLGRATDGGVVGILVQNEELGRTMQWIADIESKVKALTVDSVNAAIKSLIDPAKMSYFAAGDFANAKAKPNATAEATKK